MAKNLIIVESPAKVKTIKKFLGSSYQVIASNGHVRDLPKSRLGVDLEDDYEPQYITIRGKGPVLANIRKEAKKADKIYLATDPDREGEAISWHLANVLGLKPEELTRITFNEITKNAVRESLKLARAIDMNLVNAQQSRRVLDRIVGYTISPLLWEKVKRGLSAGRVQSVALKLIADREGEISAFIPSEYWTVEATFCKKGSSAFVAKLYGENDKKLDLKSKVEVDEILDKLENAKFSILDVKVSERSRKAPLPFTTSTMQQEASKQLNLAAGKTMQIAQQLYEGVNIKKKGTIGLITYLRTDSTRISEEALLAARVYIEESYGKAYLGNYKVKKNDNIQDAHEAIRPSDVNLSPSVVSDSLDKNQLKLYTLIWKRFVASQMSAAKLETTSAKISSDTGYRFTASTQREAFGGFLEVYKEEKAEKLDKAIQALKKGDLLDAKSINGNQHFTEPPAHFTEASLIKILEQLGIGRPSTYAPTISTLMFRHYINKEKKQIIITELGEVVNKIMNDCFSDIVDVSFTAKMEEELDNVAEGKEEWKDIVRTFYPNHAKNIDMAKQKLEKVTIADEVTEEICDKCGNNMVIKYGPHGKFLACPGFPECRNSKPYLEKLGVACPICGKDIVIRRTKKGRKYFGCEGYPDCDFVSWNEPTGEKCKECGSALVKKGKKIVCDNRECGHIEHE